MSSTSQGSGVLQSREDFKQDPRGQYKYWNQEITGSEKQRKRWHKQGDMIVKRFLDWRQESDPADITDTSNLSGMRLNLFHTNITVLQSMLYGNVPKVDVSRRFADPNDDISRVAAEIIQRLLNNDIEDDGEHVSDVLRACLQDRLLPGLGCARVRYEVETEEFSETVLAVDETGAQIEQTVTGERTVFEDAPVDYFYWHDVLWGWSRTWSQIPWLAYRSWLTKDEVKERFGEEVCDKLEYRRQTINEDSQISEEDETASVWQKAEIWEIWDKKSRQVIFYSKGYEKILETRDDPLGLTNFFPSPPFFLANQTTSLYSPTPDFHIARQLYNEIDYIQSRIAQLTSALKVVGVYDASAADLSRMLKEGDNNHLIPVQNWGVFSEKGGLAGAIQWMPLKDIVETLSNLNNIRDQTIDLLYQVTGLSDVLRGSGGGQYEGTGQALLKAKFGSVRVQALQEEFACFASGLFQIKAEIISRHFDVETILSRSNIDSSFDQQYIQGAVELIKDPERARLRVKINPESVAMVDYAQLKQERTEYITALATFMQSAAPLLDQDPGMMPYLLQLLQWALSGLKGSQQIEGVLDQAIDQAIKKSENPQPDPAQEQAQQAMQIEQMRAQVKLQEIQAKAEADARIREMDMQADIQTAQAQHQAKLAEIDADMKAKLAEIAAKLRADLTMEQMSTEANISQTEMQVAGEVQKDSVNQRLEVEREIAKTELKLEEIQASIQAKMEEKESDDNDD